MRLLKVCLLCAVLLGGGCRTMLAAGETAVKAVVGGAAVAGALYLEDAAACPCCGHPECCCEPGRVTP
jgi:hypothetical protein